MKQVLVFAVLLVVVLVMIIPTTIIVIGNIDKEVSSADNHNKVLKGEDISIKVYMHGERRIVAMNLEDYVKGVVAAEMPAEFELEALKAQAVAARTYAAKNMVVFGGSGAADQPGADVTSDYRQNQAFLNGEQLKERWGKNYERYWAKVSQAVAETRGLVVTYNGEFINAVFHSTSGERTASAKEVWGIDYPYLVSVACNSDQKAPRYHDRKEFSLAEVEKLLGAETQVVAAVQNGSGATQVIDKTDSGRISQIRIGSKVLSGSAVREKLELRSTNFSVELQGDKMIFNTIGYGHGVGLCQYGANGLAKEGQDYRQIITKYYTGVTIKNIIDP